MTVARVFDGDTVRLTDGRHLRFIGLDTPEMAHDRRPAEPLADEATAALQALLAASEGELRLRHDAQAHDRHGRLLAHPFLADGRSPTAELLRRGLASTLIIPPNVWNADCYGAAERAAREAGRGLWALPAFRPVESTALPRDAQGFHIVRGRVTRLGEGRHTLWLNLEGGVAAKIVREDLAYFRDWDLRALRGRRVEIRGWVYRHEDELRLRLRHPAALAILP